MRLSSFAFVLTLGVIVLSNSYAQASDTRLTALVDETMDGQAIRPSGAEKSLVRQLVNAGYTFIDEVQSRKIRSVTDVGQLMTGSIPDVITTLDADVIIAATCRTSRFRSDIIGDSAFRYDTRIEAQVIAVDNGQVLAAVKANARGLGLSQDQAKEQAVENGVKVLIEELKRVIPKSRQQSNITLNVSGLPNVSATKKLLATLKIVPGVVKANVLRSSRGMSKIGIEVAKQPAGELAMALDEHVSLGLMVIGYTDRVIKAEYSMGQAMQLNLVPGTIDKTGLAKSRWHGDDLSRMLQTALASSEILHVSTDFAPMTLSKKSKHWAKSIKAKGLSSDQAIVLTGDFRSSKTGIDIEAKLVAAASGGILVSANRSCENHELATCVAQLGHTLVQALPEQLKAKRHFLRGRVRRELAHYQPESAALRPIQIMDVAVENIFPARMATYGMKPIGQIHIKNIGNETLEDVVLEVNLPDFMTASLTEPIGTVAANDEQKVPIKIVLNRKALLTHNQNRPAIIGLTLRYRMGKYQGSQTRNIATVIHDRHAMSWDTPDSIASFITARESRIMKLAQSLHDAIPKELQSDPWALPAALYYGLNDQGLKYTPDPAISFGASTLDFVRYPAETLLAKSGDCDDLAVLYVALAEAVGRRALLVTTPGHAFVAISSNLPHQASWMLSTQKERLIIHDGEAWIPIETTKLGSDFKTAWHAAGTELARWKENAKEIQVIDVRNAWQEFPPASLTHTLVLAQKKGSTPSNPGQLDEAQRLFKIGANAYKVGQYMTAVQSFELSYNLAPRSATVFSLAQAYRLQFSHDKDTRHLHYAMSLYRMYLEVEPNGRRRTDASSHLTELSKLSDSKAPERQFMADVKTIPQRIAIAIDSIKQEHIKYARALAAKKLPQNTDKEHAKALLEQATILAHIGSTNDAKILFNKVASTSDVKDAALNNLANVRLNNGDVKGAIELYRQALTTSSNKIEIHLNTALAYFVSGDKDAFSDQILACLNVGGEQAVERLARAGYSGSGKARSAGGQTLKLRDLALAIRRAAKRSGHSLDNLEAIHKIGTTASQAQALPIDRFLYWL